MEKPNSSMLMGVDLSSPSTDGLHDRNEGNTL